MIPARLLRPAKLNEVTPPGILLGVGKYGTTFLAGGAGDAAVACVLSHDHQFEAFPLSTGTHYDGLAVEGIDIEVDPDSRYDPAGMATIAGSMIREGSDLKMGVVLPGGFRRVTTQVILAGQPSGSGALVIGFTRWRAVVRDDDRLIEVCSINVMSPNGER